MPTEDAELRETARRLAELAGLRMTDDLPDHVAGTQRFLSTAVGALRTLDLQDYEPATVFRPVPAEGAN